MKLQHKKKKEIGKTRQKLIEKKAELSSNEIIEKKDQRRLYMKYFIASQSNEDREARLQQMRQHYAKCRGSQ